MALLITDECISCGACLPECPNEAIFETRSDAETKGNHVGDGSPVRCSDEPSAGGLAPRIFDVLHEYASGPSGSAHRSHDAAWQFRPSTGLGTLSKSKGNELS
jgi:ferredoxin